MAENGRVIENGGYVYPFDWSPYDEAREPYTADKRRFTARFEVIPGGRTIWRRDRTCYREDDYPGVNPKYGARGYSRRKLGLDDAVAEMTSKIGIAVDSEGEAVDRVNLGEINTESRPLTLGQVISASALDRIISAVGSK